MSVSLTKLYEKLKQEKRNNPLIDEIIGLHENVENIVSAPKVSAGEMFPTVADMIRRVDSELLICLYKFQDDSYGGQEILKAINDLKLRADKEKKRLL